jgi:hypothetical protein
MMSLVFLVRFLRGDVAMEGGKIFFGARPHVRTAATVQRRCEPRRSSEGPKNGALSDRTPPSLYGSFFPFPGVLTQPEVQTISFFLGAKKIWFIVDFILRSYIKIIFD